MIKIPGKDYELLNTEVTQRMYTEIMGENPSYNKGTNNPVECVSWYDAIYFCNKLSIKFGLTPVYSVNGTTDITKWGYTPHRGDSINGTISRNINADGFRLPTNDEWGYAALGGQNYRFAGSNNLYDVGWYYENSNWTTHPVAMKKANGYGLYDMSGNVHEWVGEWATILHSPADRYLRGGSYDDSADFCEVFARDGCFAHYRRSNVGFRLLRQR